MTNIEEKWAVFLDGAREEELPEKWVKVLAAAYRAGAMAAVLDAFAGVTPKAALLATKDVKP